MAAMHNLASGTPDGGHGDIIFLIPSWTGELGQPFHQEMKKRLAVQAVRLG